MEEIEIKDIGEGEVVVALGESNTQSSIHARNPSMVPSGSASMVEIKTSTAPTSRILQDLKSLDSKNRGILAAKLSMIFIFLVANFLYTRKLTPKADIKECLQDNIFALTQSLNDKVNTDPTFLKSLQISSSSVVDFAEITFLITFYFKSNSLRCPLALLIFYATRGLVQGMYLFRFPEGTIWDYPGIPSLTVPYGRMSDFYYSGHCGFVTLVAFENYRHKNRIIATLQFLSIVYLGFVLVVTRVHYSIDIPIGIMAGAYANYLGDKFSLPLQIIFRKYVNKYIRKIKFFSEN